MDYELAKQLKDAGFLQDIQRPVFDYEKNEEIGEVVVIPTLIQLIEACPARQKKLHSSVINDCYFTIQKTPTTNGKSTYHAYYEDFDTHYPVPGFSFISLIPEEAVANLLLALNKPNYETEDKQREEAMFMEADDNALSLKVYNEE